MNTKQVKIGLMPTKRDVFNHPQTFEVHRQLTEKLSGLLPASVMLVSISKTTPSGMVESENDALMVAEQFATEKVDGIFVPHCNFGSEGNVAYVASKLHVPVLIWGPRDDDPSGQTDLSLSVVGRARDSQCGLFATGKALRRLNVPFTYLPNCKMESPAFHQGLEAFARVCGAVSAFRETKILQIGNRPDPFWSVICNEGELLEKFGIRLFPISLLDLAEAVKAARHDFPGRVRDVIDRIQAAAYTEELSDETLEQMAGYELAIKALCARHCCNAVATSCWSAFRKTLGISACAVNGFLMEDGIPVACELDVHGAITSRLLLGASLYSQPPFFADLTIRHPENDNAELLWHCGNFPPSLSQQQDGCSIRDCVVSGVPCPGKSYFHLRPGDVTLCRFDGDHGEYSLLMGHGRSISGPSTIGTYCWFETQDWLPWEEKLVTGPYVHHGIGVYGKLAPVLHEACKYLGITPDPVQPDENWIKEFWRGRVH